MSNQSVVALFVMTVHTPKGVKRFLGHKDQLERIACLKPYLKFNPDISVFEELEKPYLEPTRSQLLEWGKGSMLVR